MERVWREGDGLQFRVGNLYSFRIFPVVEFRAYPQSRFRGSFPDEVHYRCPVYERMPPPVLGDETEHAVLDLVPLAGSRGEVGYVDGKGKLVGQLL